MKKTTLFIILLIIVNCKPKNLETFEGEVEFSINVSTDAPELNDAKNKLLNRYGDKFIMYYSKNGNLYREYPNSKDNGIAFQAYHSKKEKLYLKYKNSQRIDSADSKKNTFELIEISQKENETIIDLDCECYEFKVQNQKGQISYFDYCFNSKTPILNPNLFNSYNSFFLNKFYELSERPFLKSTMRTDDFKIEYVATKLIEIKVDTDIFVLK